MTVLNRNYGPLELNVRSYNGNFPGPTLSFEAGPAPTLPTILSVTLLNKLEKTTSSTTVKNKVDVRDSFGLMEKTITVQRVPQDVAACAYVDVGTGAGRETMYVQRVASTGSLDVDRGTLGTTPKVHEVGSRVITSNMSLCDFPKQENHSNFYVYGMANVTAEHVSSLAEAQGNLTTDYFFDFAHPRGTFLYHPMWMGSAGLQSGGGMAGMLVVRDSVGDAETAFLNLREVHLLFQQLSYRNPSDTDVNRFYDHGYLQKFNYDELVTKWNVTFDANAINDPEWNDAVLTNGQFVPSLTLLAGQARDGCTTFLLAVDSLYIRDGNSPRKLLSSGQDASQRCTTQGQYVLRSQADPANDPLLGTGAVRKQQDLLVVNIQSGTGAADPLPAIMPVMPDRFNVSLVEAKVSARQLVLVGSSGSRILRTVPPTDPVAITERNLPWLTMNGDVHHGGQVRHCVVKDSIQEWEIQGVGQGFFTFHLQSNYFMILSSPAGQDVGSWRDTYAVQGGSKVVIRFKATNISGNFLFMSSFLSNVDVGQARRSDLLAVL
ncbi:hypothetical protein GUITHDRAFT_141636 [Guillardia theta CCMP2712]|uniref:Plastocyanin-like domain-containing protein n=1 Tax=Guillardia theta (strain CCMP2712) TaxID=905079 RepID=L1J039_GUITC|nr:hypothetical protein GUITHDRAFT_141636 [Guillardia theta CCMP2712]EKX41883.1 hypothetical protein GUITHDRAFT_141636 [Guillardia theta CCMP2712]|eukprot:XP_005828863.1 hypothetical protein GUITHDRAFT_141636 [Guillardia theta CCMP2712]